MPFGLAVDQGGFQGGPHPLDPRPLLPRPRSVRRKAKVVGPTNRGLPPRRRRLLRLDLPNRRLHVILDPRRPDGSDLDASHGVRDVRDDQVYGSARRRGGERWPLPYPESVRSPRCWPWNRGGQFSSVVAAGAEKFALPVTGRAHGDSSYHHRLTSLLRLPRGRHPDGGRRAMGERRVGRASLERTETLANDDFRRTTTLANDNFGEQRLW